MTKPVMAGDGYVYEKSVIKQWMKKNSVSPITGESMIPNTITQFVIKLDMMAWCHGVPIIDVCAKFRGHQVLKKCYPLTTKIGEIKRVVSRAISVKSNELDLTIAGKPMDNDRPLDDLLIRTGVVFTVLRRRLEPTLPTIVEE